MDGMTFRRRSSPLSGTTLIEPPSRYFTILIACDNKLNRQERRAAAHALTKDLWTATLSIEKGARTSMFPPRSGDRRRFLKFLARSPAIAALGGVAAFLEQGGIFGQDAIPHPADEITDPSKAVTVFDFEEPAHRRMLPGHWAYMVSGSSSDGTLHANREGFNHIQLNPARLRDVSRVDMKIDLFGTTYNSPIFTCPTGGERNIWLADGELSVARAARARGTMQMLSFATSNPVEDVNKALGRPVWMQLYAPPVWENCKRFLERVGAAGCPVVNVTVDIVGGNALETDLRLRPRDLTTCSACHAGDHGSSGAMSKGFDNSRDLLRSPLGCTISTEFAGAGRESWA